MVRKKDYETLKTKYDEIKGKIEENLPDREEFGKIVSGFLQNPSGLADVGIHLGLVYYSNKYGLNPLWGSIGLKLACTYVGESSYESSVTLLGVKVPFNSQVVGLTMLGVLGFGAVMDNFKNIIDTVQKNTWVTLKTCEEKRVYANALKWGIHNRRLEDQPSYIDGWYDLNNNPNTRGYLYLECKSTGILTTTPTTTTQETPSAPVPIPSPPSLPTGYWEHSEELTIYRENLPMAYVMDFISAYDGELQTVSPNEKYQSFYMIKFTSPQNLVGKYVRKGDRVSAVWNFENAGTFMGVLSVYPSLNFKGSVS